MIPAETVATWLRLFIAPGQVTEMRALAVSDNGRWHRTEAGFYDYDHLLDMAQAAIQLSPNAMGVYFIPNPIKPELLARCANRMQTAKESVLTTDDDILFRRWMLVDADPIRPDGISSTDEEKKHAYEAIVAARQLLKTTFDFDSILADSGNGYHLLVPVGLNTDDQGFVKRMLDQLGNRLDTSRVKIDRKVFNPARIVKLYGTWSRKGDSTNDRPHRLATIC